MTVPLTGDFPKLLRLVRGFDRAGRGEIMREFAPKAADYALFEQVRSFHSEQSPDGQEWVDGPYTSSPKLQKSGKLQGGFKKRASTKAIAIVNRTRYAHYHQHGAKLRGRRRLMSGPLRRGQTRRRRVRGSGDERGSLPARPIVAKGMPPKWDKAWGVLMRRILEKRLGG